MTQAIIALTHSLFNAALARFPSPEVLISAFAVAKSILQMIQYPVSMIKHTVTALTTDAKSYYKVRRFIAIVGIGIVVMFFVFAFTGLSRWVMKTLIGVEGQVLEEAVVMLRILVLFPLFVTVRDFYQGVAIKLRMTPVVTMASLMRVIFVGIMVFLADFFSYMPGSYYAPGIFAIALFVEATTVTIIIHKGKLDIPEAIERQGKRLRDLGDVHRELNNRFILMFFLPLTVTALLRTLATPIINAGLARTVNPEIGLSAFAVGWSVGFLAVAPLMMFHQVPLNFLKENDTPENYQSIKKFAAIVGGTMSLAIGITSFTPLGNFVFQTIIGTDELISKMAIDVLRIMTLLPIFFVIRQYLWGLFLKRQSTKQISIGKMVNLVSLIFAVLMGTYVNPENPAIIGAYAMVIAEMVECIFLFIVKRRLLSTSKLYPIDVI
ncbi:MAG: hypothetical protein KMY55_12495 [Dethiosulfatibacter sp.]|nr:hypothetical protein [Dethiosulfatibacter sp.]